MALLGTLLSLALLLSNVHDPGTTSSATTGGGTCPASAPTGITRCFYADYVNGSDTNDGTSESTPLQHMPGMVGCVQDCSAITPSAGEGFILRGGITWPSAALPWEWLWGGTATTSDPGCTGSGCIYIGVDPEWYTGAAWERPILNGGGSSGSQPAWLFGLGESGNYVILDNIEFTGLYWSGTTVSYGTANIDFPGGDPNAGMHDTIEHVYIHGWSHAAGSADASCGINGDTADVNENVDSIVEYSIIDGSDTDQASCNGAIFGGPPYIAYNLIQYVASCMIIDGTVTVHDNVCQHVVHDFQPGAHENALLVNWDGQNLTIYNNVIRYFAGSGALGIWCGIDSGHTCYIFNNVMYDTDTGNVLDIGYSLTGSTGTVDLWNNTVECGPESHPDAICAGIAGGVTAVTLQNNHFISNAGNYWYTNSVTPTTGNNVLQSKSTANRKGYRASETYAFSPTSAGSATVGAGSSAAYLCSTSGVTACLQSTTYGVIYNTTNHTVSTPALLPKPWNSYPDAGAYSFGKPEAAAPAPPQNLRAVVR